MKRAPRPVYLTPAQIDAVLSAITFATAGEWPEEFDAQGVKPSTMARAQGKLREAIATMPIPPAAAPISANIGDRVLFDYPTGRGVRRCTGYGKVVGITIDGLSQVVFAVDVGAGTTIDVLSQFIISKEGAKL